MIYDRVKYILDELSNINEEKNLVENLKLISYYCDSNYLGKATKYFRKLIEKINIYADKKNRNYHLYIIKLILLFLMEIKNVQQNILIEENIFKLLTTLFLYIEKTIKQRKLNIIYNERRREIISIIYNNFRYEFYYRKNRRFLSIQYDLPFN